MARGDGSFGEWPPGTNPVAAADQTPAEGKQELREVLNAMAETALRKPDETTSVPVEKEPRSKTPENPEEGKALLAFDAGVLQERTTMQQAESAYLAAYKDFYAKNNALQRLGKEKFNTNSSQELGDLKRSYDLTRVAYAQALDKSVAKRYDEKHAEDKGPKTTAERRMEVLARYNRLVRFNEVVKPGAEKKIAARTEALDAKGQSVFEKGLVLLGRGNAALEKRYGKNGARAIRAGAFATLTVVAGLGSAVGAAGILALTGHGAVKFLRSLGFGTASAALTGKAANLYERTIGKKKQDDARGNIAKERGGKEGRSAMGNLDLERLENIDQARVKNIVWSDERTLERKKGIVKLLTAMGLGVGVEALSGLISVAHADEVLSHEGGEGPTLDFGSGPVEDTPILQKIDGTVPHVPVELPSAEHTAFPFKAGLSETSSTEIPSGGAVAEAQVQIAPPALDHDVSSEAVKGDGAIKLYKKFQTSLIEDYKKAGIPPPLHVQKILSTTPERFAKQFDFYHPGEINHESADIQIGSKLTLSSNGDVLFVPKGGDPITLEHEASGVVADRYNGPFLHTVPKAPEIPAPTSQEPDGVDLIYGHHEVETPAPVPEAVSIQNPSLEPTATVPLQSEPATTSISPESASLSPAPETSHQASLDDTPLTPSSSPEDSVQTFPTDVVTNRYDVAVPRAEAHVYMGAGKHLLVFGNSPAKQMEKVLEYLKENPKEIVYGTDPEGKYRLPYQLSVDGKSLELSPAGPARDSNIFSWLFGKPLMKAPDIDELKKPID